MDRICPTRFGRMSGKTTNPMMNQQLEIALPAKPCRRSRAIRAARPARARWWFSQMHRVVEEAADWTPPAAPRGNQAVLDLARAG